MSRHVSNTFRIELLCKAVNIKIRNVGTPLISSKIHSLYILCSSFQAVFEFLAYKMGVAKGTLTKRMKAVLKKREV